MVVEAGDGIWKGWCLPLRSSDNETASGRTSPDGQEHGFAERALGSGCVGAGIGVHRGERPPLWRFRLGLQLQLRHRLGLGLGLELGLGLGSDGPGTRVNVEILIRLRLRLLLWLRLAVGLRAQLGGSCQWHGCRLHCCYSWR